MPEPKDTEEAFCLIKQAISNFFHKNKVVKNTTINFLGKELKVSTLWTVIADLTHQTYDFFQIDKDGIHLNFSELDFSGNTPIEIENIFIN